ncbi:MAG: carboxypeptidase-like regulatory domain-containing protein, partial [Balneolales bacterium]|nr:carboxypeptidase-like regulatory domain-containing protein [Balneolales bacterium]
MQKPLLVTLFLLLQIFVSSQLSIAQNTGTLSGYVTDARTGEPLTGATVALADTQLGAFTDLDGYYTISRIPPGNYTVVVTYVGYEREERINISIRTAGNRDINFELREASTELDEVVVTVSEPFRNPDESPLSYRRLSPEEISTYPAGNSDIAKVVQSLPGVSGSVTGFRNDVIIRGGAPNENIYFLDEIEIPTINHFSTQGSGGGPAGLLNVTFFDGVELSTSAFGAGYGNALSGVLQFNQRTGNDREFRSNFRVGASEAAITAEGPLFKGDQSASNTTFMVSARRSYLQLLFQLIDLPFLPDYWDYQYKINHNIDRRNQIYLTGVGSIDNTSINVPSDASPEQQTVLEQIPIIRQQTN